MGELPPSFTEADIQALFKPHGTVGSLKVRGADGSFLLHTVRSAKKPVGKRREVHPAFRVLLYFRQLLVTAARSMYCMLRNLTMSTVKVGTSVDGSKWAFVNLNTKEEAVNAIKVGSKFIKKFLTYFSQKIYVCIFLFCLFQTRPCLVRSTTFALRFILWLILEV